MTKFALIAVALFASASVHAAPVEFFGEDLNTGGGGPINPHPNSDAARAAFFTNLTGGVGTETFESFATGTTPPIAIVFPGAGTATLNGAGSVESGNDGVGRGPISGTQYYRTSGGSFVVSFSAPVAAFGFYGTDIGDYGANLVLTLLDTAGNTTVLDPANTTSGSGELSGSVIYYGFYDLATQYVSISFDTGGGGDTFGFDDFSIGSIDQVTPTPEPAAFALFGLGAVALGFARRR